MIQVNSGETISFDCLDASNGQITPASTTPTISSLVFSQLDQVCGPVFVTGAEPGDTLQVEVLSIETEDWGWTGLIPGFGLLADEYPKPSLKIWRISKEEKIAWFDEGKGIRIPINPFAGEMGVARGVKGAFSTIPPYNTGVSHALKQISRAFTSSYRGILIQNTSPLAQLCTCPSRLQGHCFPSG